MSRSRGLLSCAFLALSTVLLAQGGERSALGEGKGPGDIGEHGTPALFSWGDADGDARLDLAAVSAEGVLQLLANAGEGRFEDVTERVGLSGVANAALALWIDYDADGRLDLFVCARAGASRLFRNEGGLFTDMTAASGLTSEGAVQSAHWLDHDGDGRLDLHVVTAEKSELYRGLEGGFFARTELPVGAQREGLSPGVVLGGPDRATGADGGEDPEGMSTPAPTHSDVTGIGRPSGSRAGSGGPSGGRVALGPTITEVAPLLGFTCASAIVDQANPPACIQASTTPTLGKLYPISANLFVAVGGNVGIGTTIPAAKLEVAGTARITNTLTLAPAGDQALNVSTGSIYKGGLLFLHTKGGVRNTALGEQALSSVTTGFENSASGYRALFANTTGFRNTASGNRALVSNTTGYDNTASGNRALYSNTTGSRNTASGERALRTNTTGSRNTASGERALYSNTTGSFNTASGTDALRYNTSGYHNTASGYAALRSNTTGGGNTASGDSALYSNTTGTINTASGDSALYSNTTGTSNTASGADALRSNTIGSKNTASGTRALRSNIGGTLNTASGYAALRDNITGGANTASGAYALRDNTTGMSNTASGAYALGSNTYGSNNTASGAYALAANTTGNGNTASGRAALVLNTIGTFNTASGYEALYSNTTGTSNTASGYGALRSNTTGYRNTASGRWALRYNTTGNRNTASGQQALQSNSTGTRNIALGYKAGLNLTTGNNNIAIGHYGVAAESATIRLGTAGTHTRAFVAGIRGVTTGVADAIPVLVDSAGQLGTVSSSRRFKEEIRDMGDRTERLLQLRPVVFRYKPEVQSGERPLEYGLIAEEVAEVFPELVVYDEEGKPFTVKYHLLSSMLLNELKQLKEALEARCGTHERELEELRGELTEMRGLLASIDARTTTSLAAVARGE